MAPADPLEVLFDIAPTTTPFMSVMDRIAIAPAQQLENMPPGRITLAQQFEQAAAMHLTTDSAARKNVPMATGLLDYFPDALAEVARLSKAANEKHNPGEPLHWSRGKSDDHADCIIRHMVDRGKVDDDGFLHDVKVAWRALAQLQLALERSR